MQDTITIKVTVEADFDTIQDMRRALADEPALNHLRQSVEDLVGQQLRSEVQGEMELQTEVNISSYRTTKTGPQAILPKVENGRLSWYDEYEDKTNVVGKVGSKTWHAWLADPEHTSFRYISKDKATFTAMKRKDGKWYAHKRLGKKLRRRYLGVPESVTKANDGQNRF